MPLPIEILSDTMLQSIDLADHVEPWDKTNSGGSRYRDCSFFDGDFNVAEKQRHHTEHYENCSHIMGIEEEQHEHSTHYPHRCSLLLGDDAEPEREQKYEKGVDRVRPCFLTVKNGIDVECHQCRCQ